MEHFEARLAEVYSAVDRYVKFRLNGTADAEDLVQEICLTAYRKYDQLRDKSAFKSWIPDFPPDAARIRWNLLFW